MKHIREQAHLNHEQFYRDALSGSGVPETAHDTIIGYLLHGLRPGHFLTAVLSNDLREACNRADAANGAALCSYVKFFYAFIPSIAWGSEARVTDWLRSMDEVGRR